MNTTQMQTSGKGRNSRKDWFLGMAATIALAAALILAAYSFAIAAPPQNKPAQPQPSAVQIDNFSFGPAALTIAAGTTVTWTNQDDIPHTVVGDDRSFKSAALDTGDKFSHTFTKPGTYTYFCSLHPKMIAKIVVEPGSNSMGNGASAMPDMPGMARTSLDVQLYFKTGKVLPTSLYWVLGDRLNYVADNGTVVTTALDQVDLPRTLDENTRRGLGFSPAPQPVSP